MKNVTLSAVVRNRARRQLCRYLLTLSLGLPAIALLMHLLDPGAPLAFIVVPVVAGGVLPVLLLRGRLSFYIQHQEGNGGQAERQGEKVAA